METTPNKLVEKYQKQKLLILRELYHLNYSAREASRLLGGANKDSIDKVIKGKIPGPLYSKDKKPDQIEEHVKVLLDKYWSIKILTIKELKYAGFPLRIIEDKLGANNYDYMRKLFKGWDNAN